MEINLDYLSMGLASVFTKNKQLDSNKIKEKLHEILYLTESLQWDYSNDTIQKYFEYVKNCIYSIRNSGLCKVKYNVQKDSYFMKRKETKLIKRYFYLLKNSKNRKERRLYESKISQCRKYKKDISSVQKKEVRMYYIINDMDKIMNLSELISYGQNDYKLGMLYDKNIIQAYKDVYNEMCGIYLNIIKNLDFIEDKVRS